MYRLLDMDESLGLIGMMLRDHREGQNKSLRALAAEIQVSPTFLSGVENGRMVPGDSVAHNLFVALGLTIEQRREIVRTWGSKCFDAADRWTSVAEGN